jgi:hypothetical protein
MPTSGKIANGAPRFVLGKGEYMCAVGTGILLALLSMVLRATLYPGREISLDRKYYALLCISLTGSVFGLLGFFHLSQEPIDSSGIDYSQILTVLSLLAAAIITGYFTFTYTEAASDERLLPSAISACFVLLFYLVFGALSFYMGKSAHIHNAPYSAYIGSAIMWVLLVANALCDFWDYRDYAGDD